MGFIYYEEEIAIVSSSQPVRLDIGTRAMKKNTPGSHSSWATRLIIKRLDGPNQGQVQDTHEVGIFSENNATRLDIGTGSMKENVPSSHVSWATVLKITTTEGKGDKKGQIVNYGDTVGVFSSTADFRLDIGSDALNPASSSHDSWATRLHIQKLHKILDSGFAQHVINNEWPNAKIQTQTYADRNYYGLPTEVAKSIWDNSGLRDYKWTSESFDCDDFSYVYKGAASRHVYEKKLGYPYAVGIVFGRKPGAGHACNIFLDENNDVKILEPQNGTIFDGKDWEYTPFFILV